MGVEHDPAEPPDPLIAEIHRERRDRRVLVVAAVIGIVSGVATGMGFVLGAFGNAAMSPVGARNPGLLIFFIGPPAVCMALGYAIFALVRRRRP
jgi:hypothetical protein